MNGARRRATPGRIASGRSSTHVTVCSGDAGIAETNEVRELREASYPAVLTVLMSDVDQRVPRRNAQHTWCLYKGEASYYDVIEGDGTDLTASIWYDDDPFPALAEIGGRVAFYATGDHHERPRGNPRTIDRPV